MEVVFISPLSVNPTKWSNTLKQFVGNSQEFGFDHFMDIYHFINNVEIHIYFKNLAMFTLQEF